MSTAARFIAIPLAALALLLSAGPGCGSDDSPAAFGASGGLPNRDGGTSSGGGSDGICLLNNCDIDRDCADCTDGQTICNQKEHRCIACGPNAGNKACDGGKTCTKYGNCVGNGVSCAEDAQGVPTIKCKNTADCGACGPKFRVCDEAAGKCVGCSDKNTTNCQSTDSCKSGACVAKCPATCDTDDNCNECGSATKPVHACNKHVCAECSAAKPCADGSKCDLDHGTCVKSCGLGRPGVANCSSDASCSGCTATTKCKLPINHTDGEADGTCAVPATGCSDIGKGVIVLPDPFNRATNACSSDPDCAGQGIDLNVGKILRDATGLDLIKDGNISYSMHSCASVEVLDKSCGVCVPCKQDTDCSDISITDAAGSVFGPLGSIGAAILLDKAFGPNDHKVHMFCENVAGDYGVCLPCPNILGRCAQTSDAVPPEGKCDHGLCQTGTPLGLQCELPSTCVANVCAKDPYCCIKEWDQQCKIDVDLYCKDKTCEPDNCSYRPAGWYCRSDPTQGGYKCEGDGTSPTIAAGQQCNTGAKCTTAQPGVKEPAILCTTEGDGVEGCPTGSKGKPKCVP